MPLLLEHMMEDKIHKYTEVGKVQWLPCKAHHQGRYIIQKILEDSLSQNVLVRVVPTSLISSVVTILCS